MSGFLISNEVLLFISTNSLFYEMMISRTQGGKINFEINVKIV